MVFLLKMKLFVGMGDRMFINLFIDILDLVNVISEKGNFCYWKKFLVKKYY